MSGVPNAGELRSFVERYCAAASSRDVDAYMALFAEDAVQHDPVSSPPNSGHAQIRAFRQSALDAATAMKFAATSVHTCGDHVAIDFRVDVELGEGTMTIEGIEVFTLGDDGLIRNVRAYWDDADVRIT